MAGYWRQVPSVPEAVRGFIDVQQASPGFAPPPPTLPKSVPLHIRGPVDVAVRAAKHAWLIETKRADILGKDISDERLNHLYKQGKQWFARHANKSDMKTYVNASQKQSFEDQLARGIQQPEVEGMTPEAVRSKIRNENLKNAIRLQPPFPAAVQDDDPNELPPLRLSYDEWTSILPDKAIPPQAQTDLPLGKARIPKHWSLKLVTMPSKEKMFTQKSVKNRQILRLGQSFGTIWQSCSQ